MNIFVPNVYQHSIYDIDYSKLKAAGIECISFDIDDTIMGVESFNVPRTAVRLLQSLKGDGFKVVLISNTRESRVKKVGDIIGVPWIARAAKPHTDSFEKVLRKYKLEPKQMAHVGNCLMNDIAGGNEAGLTTCLVRNVGSLQKVLHVIKGRKDVAQDLERRGIWRKNHVHIKGDQYYQLGETPAYRQKQQGVDAS